MCGDERAPGNIISTRKGCGIWTVKGEKNRVLDLRFLGSGTDFETEA